MLHCWLYVLCVCVRYSIHFEINIYATISMSYSVERGFMFRHTCRATYTMLSNHTISISICLLGPGDSRSIFITFVVRNTKFGSFEAKIGTFVIRNELTSGWNWYFSFSVYRKCVDTLCCCCYWYALSAHTIFPFQFIGLVMHFKQFHFVWNQATKLNQLMFTSTKCWRNV